MVLQPCKEISEGIEEFFFPLKKVVKFFGGAHVFVSDHMAAVKNLGRLGPTAQFPSRFFSDDINSVAKYSPVVREDSDCWV